MDVDEAVPETRESQHFCENDERQAVNSIGGFVWRVDDMKRLRRFLVLGSETPTYYFEERTLGRENAKAILSLLKAGRGVEVVNEIRKYSIEGRTVKQQPMMLALALCARSDDLPTKRRAYEVLTEVCRIPTHLFMFVGFCEMFSSVPEPATTLPDGTTGVPQRSSTGWGRAHRNAMKKWYLTHSSEDPMKLAKDITKYQKREGWSHRDIARLMHLRPDGQDVCDELRVIMKYIALGWDEVKAFYFPEDRTIPRLSIDQGTNAVLEFFNAVETVKGLTADDEAQIVNLILTYNLVREHIPTPCLNLVEVGFFR